MAALSANVTIPPRHIPKTPLRELTYPVEGADEWYVGAVVCHSSGLLVADNANADTCVGICLERKTTTAATQIVRVNISGVWWIAAAGCIIADIMEPLGPLATSDNPADILLVAGGNPSALGMLLHCGTTGTDGYVDLDQRVDPVNT